MKKIFVIAALLGSNFYASAQSSVKISDNIESIEASGRVEVFLVNSSNKQIKARNSKNIENDLRFTNDGKSLIVSSDIELQIDVPISMIKSIVVSDDAEVKGSNISANSELSLVATDNAEIEITIKSNHSINISAKDNSNVDVKTHSKKVNASIADASELDIAGIVEEINMSSKDNSKGEYNVDSKVLNASLDDASELELKGEINAINISVNDRAVFDADEVNSNICTISLKDSGYAKIKTKELVVGGSSTRTVEYVGEPKITNGCSCKVIKYVDID